MTHIYTLCISTSYFRQISRKYCCNVITIWKSPKVPDEGMSGVTEDCFQKGHLSFSGKWSWIYKQSTDPGFDPTKWQKVKAVRTRKGTFPKGSQWAKIELQEPPQACSGNSCNWAFWDKVKVPSEIQPGNYILSFRWDCQQSPQVWSSCANIQIV